MRRSLAAGAPPNFRAAATCRHRFRLGYGENQIGQVLPEGAESGRSDQLAEEPLIVLKPDVDELDTVTSGTSADVVLIDGQDAILAAANVGNRVTVPLGNARLRGIWYDAGETYGSDNGLNHCSPISTGTVAANLRRRHAGPLPLRSPAIMPEAQTSPPRLLLVRITSPLPGGADLWGITTDRVLTRNV